MVSNEPKQDDKKLNEWEQIENTAINSSNSINNTSTISSSSQDPQNDQVDLSEVETGNKDQRDFDEMI